MGDAQNGDHDPRAGFDGSPNGHDELLRLKL